MKKFLIAAAALMAGAAALAQTAPVAAAARRPRRWPPMADKAMTRAEVVRDGPRRISADLDADKDGSITTTSDEERCQCGDHARVMRFARRGRRPGHEV